MKIKWPCDFVQKLKNPPEQGGRGYPHRISAADLMDNFQAAADILPEGSATGDLLYWDGYEWRILDPPQSSGQVLKSDGDVPYWDEDVTGSAAGGWWGDIYFTFTGAYSNTVQLTFEAGILTNVRFFAGGPGMDVPGTEESPGIAAFESY